MDFMVFLMAFLAAITPGADTLLILQTTLRNGYKPAIVTLMGISTGWIIYLGILYFGFAKLFQNDIMQIITSIFGAVYLFYLAFALFKKSSNNINFKNMSNGQKKSRFALKHQYFKGLIVNLSNPKAILFFGAIVAPFMDKNLFLNFIYLFCGLLSAFILVILLCLFFKRFITNNFFNIIDKICAIIFAFFGIGFVIRIFIKLI